MTAATYQSTTVTDFGSDATSHAANMPATVNSGDLLLAFAAFDATATITTPSGWTLIVDGFRESSVAATGVYAKVADGTEDSTTVDFVTSAAQRGSVHTLRFSSWEGTLAAGLRGASVVGASSGVQGVALGLGASADVHWVVAQIKSSATAWGGSPPSGYSNENKTNASEDTTLSASIASATRTNTAADETVASLWNVIGSDTYLVAVMPNATVPVTGTSAITLPFLSVAGVGVEQPKGTSAITLPFLSVAGVGIEQPKGTGAITLPFIDVAGAGISTTAASGTGALTLPFLVVAGTGTQSFRATGAITLPFLSVAGTGRQNPRGTGAVTLPFLIVDGEGLYREVGSSAGLSTVEIYDAAGDLVTSAMPILLNWETVRRLNAVGTWKATIPAIEPLVDGEPLASVIERGYRVSIVQAGTHPLDRPDLDYLLYQGVVEDKSYDVDESGQSVCQLTGSFRGRELIDRLTPTSAQYSGQTIAAVAESIVDSLGGGITYPADASTRTISVRFNTDEGGHAVGRYHRLLRVGEYARYALRESWIEDAFEFVSIDAPPESGYTAINVEMATGNDIPPRGIALIGPDPQFRREGHGIVNRIVAFGKDIAYERDENAETILNVTGYRYGITPADVDDLGEAQVTVKRPLTLEESTLTTPFAAVTGTNPDVAQEAGIRIATQPTAGDSFTIGSTTYTFQASGANSPGEINIGASLAATRANVSAAIDGSDGWNTANTAATLGSFYNADATFTAAAVDTALTASGSFSSPSNVIIASAYPPGLRDYYYIEDTASQALYGVVEMAMHRSDVANTNPEDAAAERIQAANVLMQLATLELQRHAYPKLFVTIPIVNGAHVWALPGDTMDVDFEGRAVVS